jgi:hypothetical protein
MNRPSNRVLFAFFGLIVLMLFDFVVGAMGPSFPRSPDQTADAAPGVAGDTRRCKPLAFGGGMRQPH